MNDNNLDAVRERCKNSLLAFAVVSDKRFEPFWHHRLIADKLERIEKGELKRLIISVPPRSGKSYLTTEKFPVWYLGKHPEREVIVAAYSAELAETFGFKSRDIAISNEMKAIFPGFIVRDDSQAKNHWMTKDGGGYRAVGVGGSVTGVGAHLVLIDDPLKNNDEAESQAYRDKLYNWYVSTLYTRLYRDAAIVLVQCMTGDTPVLLPDGTERMLKYIKSGDEITTYKDGKLSKSVVSNWKSSGLDSVYEIKTSSGRVVKANARHPFLIFKNGKPEWIQTKNLHPGQEIFRVNGVSGKEKYVYGKAVKNQPSVEDTVIATTEKRDGETVSDHHLSTLRLTVLDVLKTVMALLLKITKEFSVSKTACVPFAKSLQEKTLGHTGEGNSASTTVTKPEKSGPCSVMTVILLLAIQKTKKLLCRLLSTSDFTLDEIVSITPCGTEEVFDIQVAETENFIANGLVSHNTRWHLDDLAGRLIAEGERGGDTWEIVNIPALAETDESYEIKGVTYTRKAGDVIEPKLFPKEEIEQKKKVLGTFYFSALYQGKPISSEFQEFKREHFHHISLDEVMKMTTRRFMTIDTAISKKTSADNTGVTINFVNKEGKWHLMTFKRKWGPKELLDFIFVYAKRYNIEQIGIEKTVYLMALKEYFDEEMRKRGEFPHITELHHNQINKETRIRGLIPYYESDSIYHIEGHCEGLEDELLTFPKGRHDDVIDSLAYQISIVKKPYESKENKVHIFKATSFR